MNARYIVGDTRDVVDTLPAGSVDLIVTSPPFLALRSYLPADHPDKWREIGAEPTPADFVGTLLDLATRWRRVLAPHGSICVEIGDTFSGQNESGFHRGSPKHTTTPGRTRAGTANGHHRDLTHWPLDKSLCGIPTLFTWSLAYGRNLLRPDQTFDPWRIRNLLVWSRANPPVGALGDKFRPATSYVTVACTSRTRWFDLDAVRTPTSDPPRATRVGRSSASRGINGGDSGNPDKERPSHNSAGAPPLDWWADEDGPNGDRLWWMNTQPYAGAHYAAYPAELPARLVAAMCPQRVCTVCGEPSRRIVDAERIVAGLKNPGWQKAKNAAAGGQAGPFWQSAQTRYNTVGWTDCGHDDAWRNGVVLDPFAGSGTTLAAASGHGRDSIGIDIDARNADLARERVGMFLEIEEAA